MRRLHLFELEDQPWFPAVIRDAGTGYISKIMAMLSMLDGALPHLLVAIKASKQTQIIDLCSGAGGPAELMAKALAEAGHECHVTCTDLFPNHSALAYTAARSQGRVTVEPRNVDATAVPPDLKGVRTLFNAFHHFQPPVARRILEDAVESGQPIAIFEVVGRQLHTIAGIGGVPFAVMMLLPLVRPFRWLWLPLTYLIPIIPAFVLWDGLVSCLRVYDPRELRELVQGLDTYDWDAGSFPLKVPGTGTYLIGIPKYDARSEPS
jgi:hypothetical protein